MVMRALPQTTAACAPKRYQRIFRRPRTLFRTMRSSTLEGSRGTCESLRRLRVAFQVRRTMLVGRPLRVQQDGLPSKLVTQSEPLRRCETTPVRYLRRSRESVITRLRSHSSYCPRPIEKPPVPSFIRNPRGSSPSSSNSYMSRSMAKSRVATTSAVPIT